MIKLEQNVFYTIELYPGPIAFTVFPPEGCFAVPLCAKQQLRASYLEINLALCNEL